MTAFDDIETAWALLEHSHPAANELHVREFEIVSTPYGFPLFAVDDKLHRHLLIPVSSGADVREDKRSAGVQVVASPLIDAGSSRRFVDLACRKPHLNTLFSIILNEVLDQLSENGSRPDLVCHQVLNRWRELLERAPSGRPALQTIAGVFGELYQLREVVRLDSFGVDSWVGPTGARHDLTAGDVSLEVKTTIARNGRFFTINGHDQLEPPLDGTLFLAAVRLEPVKSKGETLLDVVESIVSLGGDQHNLLTLLASIGFTVDVLDACRDVHFRVGESRLYRVDDTFPRIVSSSFDGDGLPTGVLKIVYEIDLSSEPPHALDETAVEAVYHSLVPRQVS